MVALVGGNSLGLSLGSGATLGQRGTNGAANTGRSGEAAYVNAATGNLVLQDRDDFLAGRGLSVASVRTYNSQGLLSDDNADNWSMGVYAHQLQLTGTRNAVGSSLLRTDRDGSQSVYVFDAATSRYITHDGGGAYDTIAYDSASTNFVWTDGDTGTQESYDSAATGRLLSTRDTAGNTQLRRGGQPVGLHVVGRRIGSELHQPLHLYAQPCRGLSASLDQRHEQRVQGRQHHQHV